MDKDDAIKLLMRCKALWPKQSDDPLVVGKWCDAFHSIEYRDANVAVTEIRDSFEDDPPVIGQLRRAALQVWTRREAAERAQRRALEDQSRDPELVSIHEMVDAFFKRQNTTREAVFKRLGWDKIGNGGRGGPRSDGGG